VLTYVLGAPGSGKTTIASHLRMHLPSHSVVDWDSFMEAASDLSGHDVRTTRESWPSYRSLILSIVETIRPPVVLLGVCTPDELDGWPVDASVLLDCADDEREQRLGAQCRSSEEIAEAVADARRYRSLGLSTVDTTGLSPEAVAREVATLVSQLSVP
jgi:broad-specificity NMP kinase